MNFCWMVFFQQQCQSSFKREQVSHSTISNRRTAPRENQQQRELPCRMKKKRANRRQKLRRRQVTTN
jgi:hypothetical protein